VQFHLHSALSAKRFFAVGSKYHILKSHFRSSEIGHAIVAVNGVLGRPFVYNFQFLIGIGRLGLATFEGVIQLAIVFFLCQQRVGNAKKEKDKN
jgi:hypothetical protein